MLSLLENAALPRPIDDVALPIFEPRATPMRFLSGTELATLQLTVPAADEIPLDNAGVCAVAHRLAVWQERGMLAGRSGWSIAASLQQVIWWRSRGWHVPWRGLDLLRLLDATSPRHGVQAHVSLLAAPDGDYGQTRLAEVTSLLHERGAQRLGRRT